MSPGRPRTNSKLTPLLTPTWTPVIRPGVAEAEKALGLSGVRARLGWDREPNAQECSKSCAWLQGPPPGSPLIASQTGLQGDYPVEGPWSQAGLLSGPALPALGWEALWKGRAALWPQSPAASHKVLSSPEPVPMTAVAQERAESKLAGAPHQGQPLPQPNLFCLLCAACPVAPSALTPDPDCNSSSPLTTVFTQ